MPAGDQFAAPHLPEPAMDLRLIVELITQTIGMRGAVQERLMP